MNRIYFKAISKEDEDVKIEGYVNYHEIDELDNPIMYYNGLNETERIPLNPYNENTDEFNGYNALVEAYNNDDMLLQWLADFHDENKTVDRGDYILIINEGASNE